MTMYCDKQEAIHIASNLVFHEHIKHKEGDYNLVQGKVESSAIATPYVSTGGQVSDMFMKPMCKTRLNLLCNKLGLYDIYAPA